MLNCLTKRVILPFIAVIYCIMFSLPLAYGATQYVSDNLIITMREGMGNEYKIIKTLKSGTPVEVIEEMGDYYRVRTGDGKEGWVLKRFIETETPKPIIIAGLQKKIERLNKDIETLKNEKTSLNQQLQETRKDSGVQSRELEDQLGEKEKEIAALKVQLDAVNNQYKALAEASKDVVKIVGERDVLKQDNARLTSERAELLQENKKLVERNMIFWFLAGGGVFFVGWIAGKVSRKKKTYY